VPRGAISGAWGRHKCRLLVGNALWAIVGAFGTVFGCAGGMPGAWWILSYKYLIKVSNRTLDKRNGAVLE